MADGKKEKISRYDVSVLPNMATILQMAREGATEVSIMRFLGLSSVTWYEVIKAQPEFADKLYKAKSSVDVKVENALLKRALGYSYIETETTEEKVVDASGNLTGSVKTKTVKKKKQKAPDVTAQFFWLQNRAKDAWKNVSRLEHSGPDGGSINTDNQVTVYIPENKRNNNPG